MHNFARLFHRIENSNLVYELCTIRWSTRFRDDLETRWSKLKSLRRSPKYPFSMFGSRWRIAAILRASYDFHRKGISSSKCIEVVVRLHNCFVFATNTIAWHSGLLKGHNWIKVTNFKLKKKTLSYFTTHLPIFFEKTAYKLAKIRWLFTIQTKKIEYDCQFLTIQNMKIINV